MTKFEEEFNYLIELSGKVLIGQVDAEVFEKNRIAFFEKYETVQQQPLPVVPKFVGETVIGIDLDYLFSGYSNGINEKAKEWLEKHRGVKSLGYYICQLRFQGFTIEKPQLFKLIFPNSTAVLQKDGELNSFADTVYKRYLLNNAMTEQEIKSIDERYWQFAVPVEDNK